MTRRFAMRWNEPALTQNWFATLREPSGWLYPAWFSGEFVGGCAFLLHLARASSHPGPANDTLWAKLRICVPPPRRWLLATLGRIPDASFPSHWLYWVE